MSGVEYNDRGIPIVFYIGVALYLPGVRHQSTERPQSSIRLSQYCRAGAERKFALGGGRSLLPVPASVVNTLLEERCDSEASKRVTPRRLNRLSGRPCCLRSGGANFIQWPPALADAGHVTSVGAAYGDAAARDSC
jgi:hypothetical protein